MSTAPIAEYAMVSDCHSAALVDRRGSLDWWCTPRFDSPSLFGRILDERAGHFSIRPAGDAEVERTYVDGTLVLTTNMQKHFSKYLQQLSKAVCAAPARSAQCLAAAWIPARSWR